MNEGDYFQLDLPTEFNFPEEEQYLKFDLLLENETTVVAKAVITRQDSGGGTIKVTVYIICKGNFDCTSTGILSCNYSLCNHGCFIL